MLICANLILVLLSYITKYFLSDSKDNLYGISELVMISPFLTQFRSSSVIDVYSDATPLLDMYKRVFCPSAYKESNPVKGFPWDILLSKLSFLMRKTRPHQAGRISILKLFILYHFPLLGLHQEITYE